MTVFTRKIPITKYAHRIKKSNSEKRSKTHLRTGGPLWRPNGVLPPPPRARCGQANFYISTIYIGRLGKLAMIGPFFHMLHVRHCIYGFKIVGNRAVHEIQEGTNMISVIHPKYNSSMLFRRFNRLGMGISRGFVYGTIHLQHMSSVCSW